MQIALSQRDYRFPGPGRCNIVSSSLCPTPVFFWLSYGPTTCPRKDRRIVSAFTVAVSEPIYYVRASTALAVLQMFRELASESLETFGNIGDEFRGSNSL